MAFISDIDRVHPRESVVYTVSLTNTGQVPIEDIVVDILLPARIEAFDPPLATDCSMGGYYCGESERMRWTVGTIPPGEVRVLVYQVRVRSGTAVESLLESTLTARARALSDVVAASSVTVDRPALSVALALQQGTARPGEIVEVDLLVGNRGTSGLDGVTLSVEIPSGLEVVEAVGASLQGSRVTWNAGLLRDGQARPFSMRIRVMATSRVGDQFVLLATATEGTGTERSNNPRALIRVGERRLNVAHLASEASAIRRYSQYHSILAANPTATAQPDALVDILLPAGIGAFDPPPATDCSMGGYYCGESERMRWTVGTIPAGQVRALSYLTRYGTSAIPGRVVTYDMTAKSAESRDASSHPEFAQARLGLSASVDVANAPAAPGEPIRVEVLFGNYTQATLRGVQVRLRYDPRLILVEGETHPIQSHSGNDLVWKVDEVYAREGSSRTATFLVPAGANEADLYRFDAQVTEETGTETVALASAASFAQTGHPLQVDIESSGRSVSPQGSIQYTVRVENTGSTALADVSVDILLPAGIQAFDPLPATDCSMGGYYCGGSERMLWTVGTIPAGETRSLVYTTKTGRDIELGYLHRTVAVVRTANSISHTMATSHVLVGRLVSPAPVAVSEELERVQTALSAPSPNPAYGAVHLDVDLAEPGAAVVEVYDMLGRRQQSLALGALDAGTHTITLDTSELSAGVYLVRLTTRGLSFSQRLSVAR